MMVDEGNGYEEATYNGSWVHLTVNGRYFNVAAFLIFLPFLSILRNIRIHSIRTVSEEAEEFLTLYTVLIRRV